jgi:hypothetical protein
MWLNRVWPKNVPPATYLVLSVAVIWCLWLLVFAVDAQEAKGTGLFFLGVGVFLCLTHRPVGWFQFKISRFSPFSPEWKGYGVEGVQASHLALGLVMVAMSCVYLVGSIF